jgi:hypothetical protein
MLIGELSCNLQSYGGRIDWSPWGITVEVDLTHDIGVPKEVWATII